MVVDVVVLGVVVVLDVVVVVDEVVVEGTVPEVLVVLGEVVVAGCRDAQAARVLGFVPTRGVGSALEMAHGLSGGRARVGILLAPPYAPLIVG